jgi:hypothetical protein
MSNYGFVYCMSNQSMPGLYKIGYTTKPPLLRAFELSSATGVPEPFDVLFYLETINPQEIERLIHQELDDYRPSQSREFFSANHEIIQKVFMSIDLPGGMYMESSAYTGMIQEIVFMKMREGLAPELRVE